MYSIPSLGSMIADSVRMEAYDKALKHTITPTSVVLDIGAGSGIFSLLACKYGARRVYAVESADSIVIGQMCAELNGFADRIQFIQAISTAIDLPEPIDVIVSDLHGTLPLFQQHLPSIIDARKRFLRPGGVQIPQCDRIWMAPLDAPELYKDFVGGHHPNAYGVNMEPALRYTCNTRFKATLKPEHLIAGPQEWFTLDYTKVETSNHSRTLTWTVGRNGVCHGIGTWFDAELLEGIGFSNAPGLPKTVYDRTFFPWLEPVPVRTGDTIKATVRAELRGDDYLWSWESQVFRAEAPNKPVADYRQSEFFCDIQLTSKRRKRATNFVPKLTESAQIDRQILNWMDGSASIAEVAARLMQHFPDQFKKEQEAIDRVAVLSSTHST
jgi:type I protein arginine methyltransferase